MEFGTTRLKDLALELGDDAAFIRAALDGDGERWTLRTAFAVCRAQPPDWAPARWEYQNLLLVAFEAPASTFLAALDTEGVGVLKIGDVDVGVPRAGDAANWRRKPSRAPHDASPMPYPTTDHEVSRAEPASTPQSAFQIGDGCPSFPDEASAIRAFFYGDFSTIGGSSANSYPLALIRVAQSDAWIERVRVTPTHVEVLVRGERPTGARVEVNGSDLQASKTVGRSGRVRIATRRGLADDAWLYLTRGHDWLDYRPLGSRLPGTRDLADRGVVVELPNDPESRLLALIAQGEGPRVEFKRSLSDNAASSLKSVMKTVAAFANGDGGDLLFGIDPDEVTIVGLDPGGDVQVRDRLSDLVRRHVVPTPEFEAASGAVDGKPLVVMTVRRGANAPYGIQMGPDRSVEYFVRRGASTFPATQAEVRSSVLATLLSAERTPSTLRPTGLP